jgi:hypothetical protein
VGSQVVCPRAIICPSLRAIIHLRPAMGHTTGTLGAGEIRIYRGLRRVSLIGRVSGRVSSEEDWTRSGKWACQP